MATTGLNGRSHGVSYRGTAAAALAGVLLAGCATSTSPPQDAVASPSAPKPPLPVGPIARAAVEVRTQQVPIPPPWPTLPHDTCGASALTWLVGHPRTDIPVPVDLSRRRVACTACPVAPDVRLDRLNILFDAQTGHVVRLTCG